MFRVLLGGAVLGAALIAAAEPSAAQSLLQRLFGLGGPPPPPAYQSERMDGAYGYGGSRYDDDNVWQEDYGTYRTLCVRLCDGFYFPISDNVRRERLYRDSHTCTQRCDGEARLFYYSNQGGSVETMIDMAGRPYSELPNAFKYRKALVAGCMCKPAPWSPQEAARHQGYAIEQAQGVPDDTSDETEERRRTAAASTAEGEGPYYEHGYEDPPPHSYPRQSYSSRWSRTPWARWWR